MREDGTSGLAISANGRGRGKTDGQYEGGDQLSHLI